MKRWPRSIGAAGIRLASAFRSRADGCRWSVWRKIPSTRAFGKHRNLFSMCLGARISQLGRACISERPLRPETIATALTREVHALDGNLAPYEVITLQEQVDRSTSPQLVAVTLVGVLGGLALLLAAIGLYAVMSYAVSQSTRELGLRMALGAGTSNLLRLVMSRGLTLTAGGVLLGAAAALGLTRLLGNLLYKVSPRDPLAFGWALVVMTVVSLAACFLPAWRATRTDPARALRD